MVQLNFFNDAGQALGVLNWFAVHPTSMNNTNLLISGDNKGAASQIFEKEMNPNYVTGQGPFVAAFASTNLGDISPNIMVNKGTVNFIKSDSTCIWRGKYLIHNGTLYPFAYTEMTEIFFFNLKLLTSNCNYSLKVTCGFIDNRNKEIWSLSQTQTFESLSLCTLIVKYFDISRFKLFNLADLQVWNILDLWYWVAKI